MTYLTNREAELTRLVAGNHSNEELCARLQLSGVDLRQELVALADKLRRATGGVPPG